MKRENVNKLVFKQRSIRTFNKRARNYDETIEGRMAAWSKSLLLKYIKLKENQKVIDVACGTGKLLSLLASKKKIHGYGIDISEGMINTAKKKNTNMEFKIADCVEIPYEDNFFDIMTVSVAYHHFIDTIGFAKEARRILKSTGRLYIVEIKLPLLIRKIFNIAFYFLPTGDVKIYTTKEIINNFKKNGFRLSEIVYKGPLQLLCFKCEL